MRDHSNVRRKYLDLVRDTGTRPPVARRPSPGGRWPVWQMASAWSSAKPSGQSSGRPASIRERVVRSVLLAAEADAAMTAPVEAWRVARLCYTGLRA